MAKVKAPEIAVGDRVRWKGKLLHYGASLVHSDISGVVRRLGNDTGYAYAVVAAEPFGQLYMPPLAELERLEPLAEKVAAVLEKGVK